MAMADEFTEVVVPVPGKRVVLTLDPMPLSY